MAEPRRGFIFDLDGTLVDTMPSHFVAWTEIARRHEKYRKLLRLPPEIAGETIGRGIERRDSRILIGSDAKMISLIARLFPVTYWKVLARRVGQ